MSNTSYHLQVKILVTQVLLQKRIVLNIYSELNKSARPANVWRVATNFVGKSKFIRFKIINCDVDDFESVQNVYMLLVLSAGLYEVGVFI